LQGIVGNILVVAFLKFKATLTIQEFIFSSFTVPIVARRKSDVKKWVRNFVKFTARVRKRKMA